MGYLKIFEKEHYGFCIEDRKESSESLYKSTRVITAYLERNRKRLTKAVLPTLGYNRTK